MIDLRNKNIENKMKFEEEREKDDNFPREKSHWEKYQIYYLVFGFFFAILIVLIINSINSNQIEKINERLDGKKKHNFESPESKEDEYLSRLKKEPFPEYVKKRVRDEIGKIRNNFLGGHSKEIREEWVDQVMDFPWHQTKTDNKNIVEIEKTLNKNHFGMEKVKRSIIIYLAAKNQAKKNLGKVLCLVGAPGIGKTSIAHSIAESLGKSFEKISLGGVHNESEIRGHRCTYIGAKPGVVVQAFQRAKVKNPVIVLDEIDKMGESTHNGNPAAAFLEILDPEQNDNFRDHFIELPIDLSQAMFICTANQIGNISGPLRDRMEIIEIPSYTENEKKIIAKSFIIPKLLKKYNLTKSKLTFEDEAIQKIITDYTWEAGVRKLENIIESIVSEFTIEFAKNELKSENITVAKVQEYLGNSTASDLTFKADYNSAGVVNGLVAYGQEIAAGDILPIEVIVFPGEGKITITGNLKETAEESVKVALSYVRNNLTKFGITEDIKFTEKNLHIHIPKGGIPKDGSSAGTALTTAIISALTGKVIGGHVGMTGEITLCGQVSIIGGLREKLTAAHRRGLKTIFIPKDNEKDLADVPAEVKEMEIIAVKDYWEIWDKIK
ncbi:MAG: Lon protease 1 [Mycoplasmataceae bacterium]|nr:MAG: Lon protease 1 [Mycoplasmataceae bacterium]